MHNKERSIGLIDEAEPEQLIEKIEIEGTPFNIIKINNEYFGTFGKYRITEVNEQEETVRKQLIEYSWNNIVKIMTLVVDMLNPKTE
nr:MAG: hypothetical protein [Microviridae sp.]